MFYRWHVDLAGPFSVSRNGNTHIMICVEAFSKHAEIIPIPNKESATTAYYFLHNVIARFGAMAEVVTDQGTEFLGQFQELMVQAQVDHRFTSAHHPQSNGLAERVVQTVKRALKKMLSTCTDLQDWDTAAAWVALGYRATPQSSSRVSPYHILYATQPVVPPGVVERCTEPIDMSCETKQGRRAAALQLLARAAILAKDLPLVRSALETAQHKDERWYEKLHGRGYAPISIRRFYVGQYVYTKAGGSDRGPHLLVHHTRSEIKRVLEVKESGVLLLVGKDGKTLSENAVNCAPCAVPILEEQFDLDLFRLPKDLPCEICLFPDREGSMLICESCERGFHMDCLRPVIKELPEGDWICPECSTAGVDTTRLLTAQAKGVRDQHERELANKVAAQRRKDLAAYRAQEPQGAARGAPVPAQPAGATRRGRPPGTGGRGRGGRGVSGAATAQPPIQPTAKPSARPTRRVLTRCLAVALMTWAKRVPVGLEWFDLRSVEGILEALESSMAGYWETSVAQTILDWVAARERAGALGVPSKLLVAEPEVSQLLRAVDFSWIASSVDLYGERGRTQAAVRDLTKGLYEVKTNGPDGAGFDFSLDPLQPQTYKKLRNQTGLQAVITSPPMAVVDLVLSLAVCATRKVVCLYVPGQFLSGAPRPRLQYLRKLQEQGRLLLLTTMDLDQEGQGLWCVIFRSGTYKELLLRPGLPGRLQVTLADDPLI
jgi:hypothetical protein